MKELFLFCKARYISAQNTKGANMKIHVTGSTRFLLIALLTAAIGCSHRGIKPSPPKEPSPSTTPPTPLQPHQAATLSEAIQNFSFSVLTGLRKINKENTVISVSLHMALTLLENGANGQTKIDLDQGLWLRGLGEDINSQYGVLQKAWNQEDAKTALVSANALWYVQGNQPVPTYLQSAQPYQATLQELVGSPSQKADQVNSWVDGKTNHTIPTLVTPSLMSNVQFALTNAVYFKGLWVHPFEKLVNPLPFRKEDGTQEAKVFMRKKANFVYQQGGFGIDMNISYQAIRIPYGEEGNSKVSMLLILPKVDPIDYFVERLLSNNNNLNLKAPTNWSNLLESMYPDEPKEKTDEYKKETDRPRKETVELTMPLLKLDYTANNLDSVLQNDVGLKSMYEGGADFSKLFGNQGMFVSTVIHKTFLLIDPVKTEASAATAILMTRGMAPPVKKMIVDRPFFFAIMDDQNKIPLFMGVISDPPQP